MTLMDSKNTSSLETSEYESGSASNVKYEEVLDFQTTDVPVSFAASETNPMEHFEENAKKVEPLNRK